MTNPKSIKERIEKVLSHEDAREWVLVYDDPEKIIGSYRGLPKHDGVLAHTPVIDAAYVTKLESFIRDVVPELVAAMEHTRDFCVCRRFKTEGFDYGEEHKYQGAPKGGSRWLTPNDKINPALTKLNQKLGELE